MDRIDDSSYYNSRLIVKPAPTYDWVYSGDGSLHPRECYTQPQRVLHIKSVPGIFFFEVADLRVWGKTTFGCIAEEGFQKGKR